MAKGKKKEELTIEEKLEQALVPREEWPYEVPKNWCWVRGFSVLNDMESKKPEGETFAYIDIDSIDNKRQIVTSPKVIEVNKAPSRASRKLHTGDTLFSLVRPYLMNIAYIDESLSDCIASTGFYVCSPNGINSKFWFYLMKSSYVVDGLNFYMKGDNSPSIRKDDIENFYYPLPPLAEQQRIVERIESLFSKLDEAKEKAQEALDSFEERKAAILHKAFSGELTKKWREENGVGIDSWDKKKICDFADVKGGKRIPKGKSLINENTGHPYLKAGNLKNGTVIDDGIMFVPDDVLPQVKNYTVNEGDVYITNVGACIGDCGVIPPKYDGANLTENAVKITNLKNCNNFYLSYYLSSNNVQHEIKTKIASATLGKLSIANVKSITISLPSINEQKEIIDKIELLLKKSDEAWSRLNIVIRYVEIIKKSILAKAFRGELGTNNIKEESAIKLLKSIL